MYQLVKVAEGIFTFMTSNCDFNTALGGDASTAGRFYYGQAPEDTVFPYVIFFAVDNRDETPTMSESSYAVSVQFSIVEEAAAGPRACLDIADKLRDRLNRSTFGITDHTMMAATVEIERGPVLDDRTYLQTCDYLIRGFED